MTRPGIRLLRTFALRCGAGLCMLALCAAARQTVEPAGPPKPQHPDLPGIDDPRQEMIELFQKVETRLKEIDALLYDAGAGERGLDGSTESGMSELLDGARAKSDEVLSGIDKILEIAKQQGGSVSSSMSSSSGEGSPSSGGDQPKQGAQGPQQRESTPDRPGGEKPQGSSEQPSPGESSQEPHQPDPKGGDPRSPKDQRGGAENRPGGPPPKLDTQRVDPSRDGESWGDLPEQYRELFRTEGGSEMPAQYRDWIDAYYRRLNQRR